MRNEVIM